MNDTSGLNAAKIMLREKRFQEAIAIFQRTTNDRSESTAEAAYCLGVLYQSGMGIPKSINEATKYYLIAEQSGYPMATYRLGGIYHRLGEFQKAYDSYRAIAQDNPSAAYWAYRLLMIDKHLDSDPHAGDNYLNSAAEQGHVLAQRIIAMEYVSGKNGLLKIPYGVQLFLKMAWNTIRQTNKGEKLKYD